MSLPDIHLFVANKFIEEQDLTLEIEKNELTHGVIYALLFDNIRIKDNKPFGLRLTKDGYKWLKNHYDVYEVKLNKKKLVSKHILYLDKYLEFPYYIVEAPTPKATWGQTNLLPKQNVKLLLFAGKDTLELRLLEGNIDKWVENRKTGELLNISKS
jgi:hypothetical protein